MTPQLRETPVSDYFKSVGKAVLTGAALYGLSVAAPPIGAVLIPAYTAYNYSKLGYGLFKAYREISQEGKVSPNSISRVSGQVGEVAAQSPSDAIASTIVASAGQSGLFKVMAENTGIQEGVIVEMTRGSTSSALSASGGELAKFAIMKAVGA
jgi:hypothetical protein